MQQGPGPHWRVLEMGILPGGPEKTEQSTRSSFQDFALFNSYFFILLDKTSFPHCNNTKIIKFGWELFILWVISYGLSFSGFARFARFSEFRGTINDKLIKSCKCQFIRNYSWNKKFSTKFDDLGVIIMRKRCSIHQGEKDNCWSEQSPEKSTVSTVPWKARVLTN